MSADVPPPSSPGVPDAGPDAGPYDAVVLAGGRARRLGGADKPGMEVGGRPLIESVIEAAASARTIVVVGPSRPLVLTPARRGGPAEARSVVFVREDPPGSGPVAAVRAGLAEVDAEWVAVLAADLPFLTAAHVGELLAAATTGAVLVDDAGMEQWLTGVWRTALLREALADYTGGSLHGLLRPLVPVRLHLPPDANGCAPWFDCDTMDDLGAARSRAHATRD